MSSRPWSVSPSETSGCGASATTTPRGCSACEVRTPGAAAPVSDEECPCPGLAASGPEQAAWFFGRDGLIAPLTGRPADGLCVPGPLVVVAPSGAGKSSLLQAGVVPAIQHGVLPAAGSRGWPQIVFTPGPQPLHSLNSQLAPLVGMDPSETADRCGTGRDACVTGVRQALRDALAAVGTPVVGCPQFDQTRSPRLTLPSPQMSVKRAGERTGRPSQPWTTADEGAVRVAVATAPGVSAGRVVAMDPPGPAADGADVAAGADPEPPHPDSGNRTPAAVPRVDTPRRHPLIIRPHSWHPDRVGPRPARSHGEPVAWAEGPLVRPSGPWRGCPARPGWKHTSGRKPVR
ncbi:nSTAND1 domain-containing NTPase [Streptomyces alanosinicus]|uniref:nSTAND1 domain-containing NTPase n=1 Tax=Streptomyces alanosinicus TaxID=68171 RepID=UPI0035711007